MLSLPECFTVFKKKQNIHALNTNWCHINSFLYVRGRNEKEKTQIVWCDILRLHLVQINLPFCRPIKAPWQCDNHRRSIRSALEKFNRYVRVLSGFLLSCREFFNFPSCTTYVHLLIAACFCIKLNLFQLADIKSTLSSRTIKSHKLTQYIKRIKK